MQRYVSGCATLLFVLSLPIALTADVKTRQQDAIKVEGLMGRFISSDPTVSTVAVKGNRMSSFNEKTGQIIDLTEERVYQLDMKKKTYTVVTFEDMRRQLQEARDQLAEQRAQMSGADQQAVKDAASEMEIDVKVDETGQQKTIAGYQTREVVLTLTMRAKGKTLEAGGGMVMTTDMWLAPKIASLDELAQFRVKFAKAVFGEALGLDPRQASGITAMIPAFGSLASRMAEEGRKLDGTALLSTSVVETVKSEEQMKSAADQSSSGGGGVGGALAGRFMRRGAPQARTKAMTLSHDVQSVGTDVNDTDLDIPAGFKEKKTQEI